MGEKNKKNKRHRQIYMLDLLFKTHAWIACSIGRISTKVVKELRHFKFCILAIIIFGFCLPFILSIINMTGSVKL